MTSAYVFLVVMLPNGKAALTCQTARSLECGVGIQIMRDFVLIGGVQHSLGGGQSGVASYCSAELVKRRRAGGIARSGQVQR